MYNRPLLDRDKLTPQEVLEILVEGNERFTNEIETHKDFKSLIDSTKNQQHPFVSVLSCSDSRVPVELLFDQALGDVFSVRLAGNIASDKGIGSLEFGSKYLGSKLIVVMGHTSCGGVKAACDDFKDGHIGEIVNMIKPSIRYEKTVKGADQRTSKNADFVQKVCDLNVKYQIESILRCSDILEDMTQAKEVGIIGAVYDISTGKVRFMEETAIGF
ncbi:MAG: carbonic anhydrase [Methylophilaceae bacterium]|jgi:carbonic anhydrase|nr:carbonic anhydrase [Methylophilaceae bacterium]